MFWEKSDNIVWTVMTYT